MRDDIALDPRPRLRKRDRRAQILLELKLQPHVRISDLAERFGVSGETVRRDFEALSGEGLISRDHGGASAPQHRQYPGLDERNRARLEERERIGRTAAALVRPGETVMIDSGSTTLQVARFLAFAGTECTVVTNSLPIAMTLGQSDVAEVILCPGDFLASEAAVVGTDTIGFLQNHRVDHCIIGASGVGIDGVSETVRGFAAIKRAMICQSAKTHLVVDGAKFGRSGLARVGGLEAFTSVVVDRPPGEEIMAALKRAAVSVMIAK